MTDYIHPVQELQRSLRRSEEKNYILGALLAVSLLVVPWVLRHGPVVVLDQDGYSQTVQAKPWQLTVSRMEGFLKSYLTNRWEWTPENFEKKRESLEELLDPGVSPKLKDSMDALASLAKVQHARSYYVLEGWGFSNAEQKIEARVDRVIRIKNAAVATPLTIQLKFDEAAVTETNPYGLKVESIEEVETQEGAGS